MSQERLLSVLRKPLVLVGVVSRRRRPFDLDAAPAEPYVDVALSLSAMSPATCPWRDNDLKAWRALSNVPRMTNRASLAIVRALIGSVADPDSVPADLPALDPAHPPRDLRPHLCRPDHEEILIAGIEDALAHATAMPEWHWQRRRELAALPRQFRRLFLWGLHLRPWTDVAAALAAFEALDLEAAPGLCSGLARLWSLAGPELGVAWAGLALSLEPARRCRAIELVLESGAALRAPEEADAEALASDDRGALAALAGH